MTFAGVMWVSGWLVPLLATSMLVAGISLLVYLCLPPFWFRFRRFFKKHFLAFTPQFFHVNSQTLPLTSNLVPNSWLSPVESRVLTGMDCQLTVRLYGL
jgi:hypothetical protein